MTTAQREILRGYLDHTGRDYAIRSIKYPSGLSGHGNDNLKIVTEQSYDGLGLMQYVDYFDSEGRTTKTEGRML